MDAAVENIVELAQARNGAVDNRHIRAKADGHFCRVEANDAAAKHGDLRRQYARHAAQQNAAPAIGGLQRRRGRLNGKAARDFRHWSKQRQPAALVGDGFIRHGGNARFHKPLCLLGVRRQVQIGVENLPVAQLRPFLRLRLLDLHDHVRLRENIGGGLDDFCASGRIRAVIRANAQPRAALDNHLMPMRHIFAHRSGRKSNAVFVVLDFLGAADAHSCFSDQNSYERNLAESASNVLAKWVWKRKDIRVSLRSAKRSSKESS
jgi:hypothetical protein